MFALQIKDWDKVEAAFSPVVLNQAMNAAIRKSLMKTRTQISVNVRQVYNISAGDIGNIVTLSKISYTPPSYRLQYSGARVSLRKYAARAKIVKTARGLRRGVTVRVRKDRGRKLVKHGFYGAGGWPVYMRLGRSRHKIEKRTGLAIPQMVGTKDQLDLAYKFMGVEIPKQVHTSLDFYSKRAAGKT